MRVANRRIISAIALGVFMVAAVTGLVFQVPGPTVYGRAVVSALAAGGVATVVVIVFERIWTK